MQNKTSTIITIVIVVLALIALVWPALRRDNNTPEENTTATTTTTGATTRPGSVTVTPTTPSVSTLPTTGAIVSAQTPVSSTMNLKIFLGKEGSAECEDVVAVSRVMPRTSAVGRMSLYSLLVGPTAAEKVAGYSTAINSGVMLKNLTINNGVALADFSAKLGEDVAGSCRVQAIRAQITETLKQFPTVSSVIISVDGEVDEALQP